MAQRAPLAKKQGTFPASKKKQVEAEMAATLGSSCGAPFWRISAALQFPITEAEVKLKPLHCSGAIEAGQASINDFHRDPLAKKQCTFPAPKKKQVEAEMAATLGSSCGAPFWRISAAHSSKRGPAVDKEKLISKSIPVSDHRSGGQVQALAL